jgi:hypothetical protein
MSRVAVESIGQRVATRECGLCHQRVTSAVHDRTGLRCEIETAPGGAGELAILPELPGLTDGNAPPRVTPSRGGRWREHVCPKARRAFSAANFNRKRRTP